MRIWLGVALLLGLGCLAAARYVTSPLWIDALLATGGLLGLALALALGLLLRSATAAWKGIAALLLGALALAARASLIAELLLGRDVARQVDFWRMAVATSTVVWAALGLLWGAVALSEALEGRAPRRRAAAEGTAAALGVTLALYCLAPLWSLLGLRINHWTVVGLFGLGVAAYAAGAAYRWVARRLGHASRRKDS